MYTTLFDKHFQNGFDLGWHSDIPKFTPDDWEKFLVLAYKAWKLEFLYQRNPMHPGYIALYKSISDPEADGFWEKTGRTNPRDQVRAVLVNMTSPIGKIDFGACDVYELNETLAYGLENNRWTDGTRGNFLAGLDQAAHDPIVGANIKALKDRLQPLLMRKSADLYPGRAANCG